MENASKALIMAGSVLISMMVVAILVYGYSQIRDLNQMDVSKEEAKQSTEYNKKFEAYMREDLHGADVLSVVNLITDYNEKHDEAEDGYVDIRLTVRSNVRNSTFRKNVYTVEELKTIIDSYDRKKRDMLSKKYGGKSIDQFVNMRSNELDKFKAEHPEIRNLDASILEYTNLVDDMTAFKTVTFRFVNVEYGLNGRITKLEYEQT